MDLMVHSEVTASSAFWQSALSYLREQVSQQVFELYFRPLEIAWIDDQKVVLTLKNSILARQLKEKYQSLLNEAVEVNLGFRLNVEITNDDQLVESNNQNVFSISPEDSCQDGEISTPSLLSTEARRSLHDLFVHPERSLVVPGYITRWVPYLGVERAAMLLGYFQAYYQQYHELPLPGQPFEASGPLLVSLSGVSLRSVKEHRNDLAFQWFLKEIPYSPGEAWVNNPDNSNKAKRKPNRYCFVQTMPLTPGDAHQLTMRLSGYKADKDPVRALNQIVALQPHEILSYPAADIDPVWETVPPNPQSVHDVVAQVYGAAALKPEVMNLTDILTVRLMPPKDQLFISLYFLQNILPIIGQGAGWTVMMGRDRCYYNRQTGELRDTVRIKGGYDELAANIGYARPKTIREWFPASESEPNSPQNSKDKDESTSLRRQLIQIEDVIKDGRGKATQFTLRVQMLDPLIQEHAREYHSILALAEQFILQGKEYQEALVKLLSFCGAGLQLSNAEGVLDSLFTLARSDLAKDMEVTLEAQKPTLRMDDSLFQSINLGADCTFFPSDTGEFCTITHSNLGNICTILKSNLGANCTLTFNDLGAVCTIRGSNWALVARLKNLYFKYLGFKNLQHFLNTLQTTTLKTVNQTDPVVVDGKWDIKSIFNRLGLLENVQKRLLDLGVTAPALISCLFYLAAPEGQALGIGYVVKKLTENPQMGQGGRFLRLANHKPQEILTQLENRLQNSLNFQSTIPEWDSVLQNSSRKRLRLLGDYLGIPLSVQKSKEPPDYLIHR